MEKETNFFEESRIKIQDYIQDRILLLRLEMVEKSSKIISTMFIGLLITILSFFIILFLSFMAGYYFGSVTGSMYTGFAIVCGFYVLLLLFIMFAGKKLVHNFIANTIIRIFFDQTATNDHTDNHKEA